MQWLLLGGTAIGALALLTAKSEPAPSRSPPPVNQSAPKGKNMTLSLKHFSPDEFGEWWPHMSPELLRKLDAFRERWGAPVVVSPAHGGIGRHLGDGDESQHNVDEWGEVRAVDVFPKVPAGASGYRYINTTAERERAYRVARSVGFTGIGLYTDTSPGNMLHVDVRKSAGYVATWSRVDGNYLGIEQVTA